MSTEEVINNLLRNYFKSTKNVIAAAVIDKQGLVVGSQMNESIDEEIVGAVSASFGIASERIKKEFAP